MIVDKDDLANSDSLYLRVMLIAFGVSAFFLFVGVVSKRAKESGINRQQVTGVVLHVLTYVCPFLLFFVGYNQAFGLETDVGIWKLVMGACVGVIIVRLLYDFKCI